MITLRNVVFFSDLHYDFRPSPLTQVWPEFWQGLAHWYSSKFGLLQSKSKCDQASDLGQQLGAWSGFLISLLEKFNLFQLTRQMKQSVIDVKMNKSNFDKKIVLWFQNFLSPLYCVGALPVFLLLKLPPRKLEPSFVDEVSFFWGCLLFL